MECSLPINSQYPRNFEILAINISEFKQKNKLFVLERFLKDLSAMIDYEMILLHKRYPKKISKKDIKKDIQIKDVRMQDRKMKNSREKLEEESQ